MSSNVKELLKLPHKKLSLIFKSYLANSNTDIVQLKKKKNNMITKIKTLHNCTLNYLPIYSYVKE